MKFINTQFLKLTSHSGMSKRKLAVIATIRSAMTGESRAGGKQNTRLEGSTKIHSAAHTVEGEMRGQRAMLCKPSLLHHVITLIYSTCLLRLSNVTLRLQLHCWPSHWINYF